MSVPGFPTKTWTGDESGEPSAALVQGPVRISGAVLEPGASWHVARDRLGWTTVVLIARPPACEVLGVDAVVRACADRCVDPLTTAHMIARRCGGIDPAETGVLRIGPRGQLVELLNVGLPTMVHWDPRHGIAPFEPVAPRTGRPPAGAVTEMVRLAPGAVLFAATRGVLPHHAGWKELNELVSSLAIDRFGGQIADIPPSELARLVRSSWTLGEGPAAALAVGQPPAWVQAA